MQNKTDSRISLRAQDLPHLTLALFEAGWRFTGAMRRVANAEAG